MALLQGTNYIKIKKDGEYEIYNSAEERELIKNAPTFEEVNKVYHKELYEIKAFFYKLMDIKGLFKEQFNVDIPEDYQDGMESSYEYFTKYKSTINEIFKDSENYCKAKAVYYHKILDERNDLYKALEDENVSYEELCKMQFPFIEQYYPNFRLLKLRPKVTGQIDQLKGNSVKDAYINCKKYGFFGNTQDV